MLKQIPVESVGIIIINGLNQIVSEARGRDEDAMRAAAKLKAIWDITIESSNLNQVPRPYNQKLEINVTERTLEAILVSLKKASSEEDD